MNKQDIERLWELEVNKYKQSLQRMVSKDELYITALDHNDEIIFLRSKIQDLSDTGIIVIINPDRAEKDGELFELWDLNSIKLVIFTFGLSEDAILELLEIAEEHEELEFTEA